MGYRGYNGGAGGKPCGQVNKKEKVWGENLHHLTVLSLESDS